MERLILTISILMSNRIDTMKKCLDSIQPLMNAVPSELILTDTGCGEEARSILESYTNHIINFKWINDFSAARNVGLKEAKGQWFMYLDDDEWFEDTQEIIDFFNSGECENYSVACYKIRNYLDYSGHNYKERYTDRILRINPELHFVHRIHEEYQGIKNVKKKKIPAFVHHFGYVMQDDKKALDKYERNQKLLELECKEYPDDMRMWYQLITNQYSMRKWEYAIELGWRAIARKSDDEYWDLNHTEILHCYEKMQAWDNLALYSKRFLENEMYLYEIFGCAQYAITALWHLGKYEEAAKYADEVFAMYEKYKIEPEEFDRSQLMITTFFEDVCMWKMLGFGLSSILGSGTVKQKQDVLSYDNSREIRDLLIHGTYIEKKAIIETFCTLSCDEKDQILASRSFKWIIEMDFNEAKELMTQIVNSVPDEDFEIWEEVVLYILPQNTVEELYWFALSFDRKIQRSSWYMKNITLDSARIEFAMSLLTGYSETMICLCKALYQDEIKESTVVELSPKEQAAFLINYVIAYMNQGNIRVAIDYIRYLMNLLPEWKDALQYLPMWVSLNLENIESQDRAEKVMMFKQSFFEEETINGFKIPSMMKRAWAAQLVVLEEIKRVCNILNIKYWADWGTMLGAVRHQGFIPWDDDMDICMMRKDYMRFLAEAPALLEQYFEIKSVYNDPTYDIVKARIINGRHMNFDAPFLEKFYGCPYVVGIDIFPIDNIPDDEKNLKEQVDLLKLLLRIEASIPEEAPYSDEDIDLIQSLEKKLGIKVDYQNRLRHEVKRIFDIVSAHYAYEDTQKVSCMLALAAGRDNYRCDKRWYKKSIDMQFENTTIPVPIGYENLLKLNYGDDYMVPKNIGSSHDYPFYKEQIKGLKEVMEKEFNQELSDEMMEQLISMKVSENYI